MREKERKKYQELMEERKSTKNERKKKERKNYKLLLQNDFRQNGKIENK